jgi:hypothetical protein
LGDRLQLVAVETLMPDAMASTHPAAAWYRKEIDIVQVELLAVLRKHWPRIGSQAIAHLLIELTGGVLSDIVEAEPAAGRDIDQKLVELHLYVATTTKQAQ